MSAQLHWPHIRQFLRIDDTTGQVVSDYLGFSLVEDLLTPAARATAYEEWAAFHEWHLAQRTAELATDRVKRHLVTEWTDSMTYSCRRSAALARGENPGPWTPLRVRRPDLDAERRAIVAELVANPNT
ncbi:hypothetical protein [Actinophytocola glycyrrhizae]|uniref:NIPSNAP protein n=1 Tax=Actinophytocola glycyrrhizae TaxID=2044873 RepID=A0ABV9S6Y3_9PSEU